MPTITCPNGHRFRSKPIVYGLPTTEAMEDARAGRGEIVLGGCMPEVPVRLSCPKCGPEVEWTLRSSGEGGGPDGAAA